MILFCFCAAERPARRPARWTVGREVNGLLHVEIHSWRSARWRRDSCHSVNTSKSFQKLLHQSFSVSHFILFKPLSPRESVVFYLHFFTSALCVKGWLEGYNLEETWDPITDTNIQSLRAALSPPVSHIMVTVAGLCLLGTRHPACLSHWGSELQFLSYYEK